MSVLLQTQQLQKSFTAIQATRNLDLCIQAGELHAIIGPNGAGKTTCFYMIVGIVNADQGQVTLDDSDLTALPMHGRARPYRRDWKRGKTHRSPRPPPVRPSGW